MIKEVIYQESDRENKGLTVYVNDQGVVLIRMDDMGGRRIGDTSMTGERLVAHFRERSDEYQIRRFQREFNPGPDPAEAAILAWAKSHTPA